MDRYGVPTAPFKTFTAFDQASLYIGSLKPPYVVKADGLAAGRSPVIREREDGEERCGLLLDSILGEAGHHVLIEEFLTGVEASYLRSPTAAPSFPCTFARSQGPAGR
jgi:phosphoribosylamine--glycine ligase